jgi:hypothetical protein
MICDYAGPVLECSIPQNAAIGAGMTVGNSNPEIPEPVASRHTCPPIRLADEGANMKENTLNSETSPANPAASDSALEVRLKAPRTGAMW